jgi:hypothetical protein
MCNDISEHYFVPGLRADCEKLTKECMTCVGSQPLNKAAGFYGRYDVPKYPFHTICVDTATGITGHDDFDAVLVIIDELTKMTVYAPTSMKATTKEIYETLEDRVFATYGVPSVVKCDNGSTFVSDDMYEFMGRKGIEIRPSTVGHHTHLVERAIGTLRVKLRATVDAEGRGWVRALSSIQLAVNRLRTSDGDKRAPCQRLFGYLLPVPLLNPPGLVGLARDVEPTRGEGWSRPSRPELVDALMPTRDRKSVV